MFYGPTFKKGIAANFRIKQYGCVSWWVALLIIIRFECGNLMTVVRTDMLRMQDDISSSCLYGYKTKIVLTKPF